MSIVSYVTDMLRKLSLFSGTFAPVHKPCFFSTDQHTIRRHLVIVHFILLLLSGTLFQMMSGVPHHCHHLCRVKRHLFRSIYKDRNVYFDCDTSLHVSSVLSFQTQNALTCIKKSKKNSNVHNVFISDL